jgi:hypothetical protein
LRSPQFFYFYAFWRKLPEGETMTTIDQQLGALLAKFSKIIIDCEGVVDGCEQAESYARDLSNSTLATIDRDINEAADKADEAHGWAQAMNDRLLDLRKELYALNPRLTSGAQPPAELKPRHTRFLSTLKKNNGCTVAHMAGTLGVGMGAVYSYVYDLKRLGHKVAVRKKCLYLHDLITNINPPVNSTGTNEEA